MDEAAKEKSHASLVSRYLCTVEFEVAGGLIAIGASPFGDRRLGYVTGGRFMGPRLEGVVLPGGGNWSQSGRLCPDLSIGTFDARVVWQARGGEMIYVTYSGRSRVPDGVRALFADPAAPAVDPGDYYLRIAPVFETASSRFAWLNGILAVGVGERTDFGVRHILYEIL